jgi:hypothetical protein
MSLLVDAAGDLVVLPRDAVELVERRRPVQGRLVLVVDALGHVLEPGQDEALLRRRPVDPAPHEALRQLRALFVITSIRDGASVYRSGYLDAKYWFMSIHASP